MRCGIYLRISKEERKEFHSESNSIESQRMIIRQYISEHKELEYTKECIDDGYSGINFERPGVMKLLQYALEGEIDCIIVKDLSRFGRDYIQTGRYISQVFPKLGLRFIAIGDNYDSKTGEFMEHTLLVPVLNLINDAYCRDISLKVKWQQEAKRKNGDYIGAFAVYGYKKSEINHNKLVIDEYPAEVIRWIYGERLNIKSAEYIARKLNEKEILSPLAYKKMCGSKFQTSFAGKKELKWSPMAVRRILKNEMYTGVLIQGKDKKISYKYAERKRLPKSEWVCVEHAVDAIIEKEIFEKVQRICLRNRD